MYIYIYIYIYKDIAKTHARTYRNTHIHIHTKPQIEYKTRSERDGPNVAKLLLAINAIEIQGRRNTGQNHDYQSERRSYNA